MSAVARSCAAAACILALAASGAWADPITNVEFRRITSNSAANVAGQLKLVILDAAEANSTYSLTGADALGSNEVLFVYTNAVGVNSSIREIYIDDGTVVFQSRVYNSLGGYTEFVGWGAKPGNLPSGENTTPAFEATAGFSVDSQGNHGRGVDTASDILGIAFVVTDGLSGLRAAFDAGTIRVGIHASSIGIDGESDSFVSMVVPEPATLGLLAFGLCAGAARTRRRRA